MQGEVTGEGPPYRPGDADFITFKCMDIYKDEPMPRKYKWMEPRNLTVECPCCRRFSYISRKQWSNEPLACMSCGIYVPAKEWRLREVPWLLVVREAV